MFFEPFKMITEIMFYPQVFIDVIRKQGIGWVKCINSDVNVDIRNLKSVKDNMKKSVWIYFGENVKSAHDSRVRFAYNEDYNSLFVIL